MNLLRLYECWARRKHLFAHVENIYGDEALTLGCRSIWKCTHCGWTQHRSNLATVSQPIQLRGQGGVTESGASSEAAKPPASSEPDGKEPCLPSLKVGTPL